MSLLIIKFLDRTITADKQAIMITEIQAGWKARRQGAEVHRDRRIWQQYIKLCLILLMPWAESNSDYANYINICERAWVLLQHSKQIALNVSGYAWFCWYHAVLLLLLAY